MSENSSSDKAIFENFLDEHLRDNSLILEKCTSELSLSDYLFGERNDGDPPRCRSLSHLLRVKWRKRILSACGGKFGGLDVENLQSALSYYLNPEILDEQETSTCTESNFDTEEQSTSKENVEDRISHLEALVLHQSKILDVQHSQHKNLRQSVTRITRCAASSLSTFLAQPNKALRGLWLPQRDPELLSNGSWEDAEVPAEQWKDSDDRPQSNEDMWYIFERDINDAGKQSGTELSKLYKKVFGLLDAKQMKSLDKHHPLRIAIDQINTLVSNAKASCNLTVQAAEIANQQRKKNPQGSFDENGFIQMKLPDTIDAEEKTVKQRSKRYFQNKREREKQKRLAKEKDDLLKDLKNEVEEKGNQVARLMSEIEFLKTENQRLRNLTINVQDKSPKRALDE